MVFGYFPSLHARGLVRYIAENPRGKFLARKILFFSEHPIFENPNTQRALRLRLRCARGKNLQEKDF